MTNKKTIELNGNHYDAVTGHVVSVKRTTVAAAVKPASAKTTHIAPKNSPQVVDGIFRASHHATVRPAVTGNRPAKPTRIAINGSVKVVKAKTLSTVHSANHVLAHQPQTAITLMRAAVKKPGPGFKKSINVQSALSAKSTNLIVKKTSVNQITPQRLLHAKSVHQSLHISRFEHGSQLSNITLHVAHLPVQAAPTVAAPAAPAAPHRKPYNKPDMFEQAIANASHFVDVKAHSKHLRKKAKRHVISMAAGTLALLVIATFAVFQNTPGLQIGYAGMKAGFASTTPNFKAAGFAYTGVNGQSGKLTIGFAGSDGAKYNLVQTPTSWSAADMIQNVSSTDQTGQPNYQTLQAGNTEVYRFDNNSATWVKNGKWYQVNGQSGLSDQQVQALAQNS
jgi:hypothetical protein